MGNDKVQGAVTKCNVNDKPFRRYTSVRLVSMRFTGASTLFKRLRTTAPTVVQVLKAQLLAAVFRRRMATGSQLLVLLLLATLKSSVTEAMIIPEDDGGTTIAGDGDVNIEATGNIDLSAGGSVTINGSPLDTCNFCERLQAIEEKLDSLISPTSMPISPTTASCKEAYESGYHSSGVYTINPGDGLGEFDVYCDMTTNGGGWTVFQRRKDGSVDFFRGWEDYKTGFGDLNGEFWLGLDKIHRLAGNNQVLRVDLEDFEGNTRYAQYGTFSVGDENQGYQLTVGQYSGNAGDSLGLHNGFKFSTKDSENSHCATTFHGAWWYEKCHYSNLNGKYLNGPHSSYADGVNWFHWHGYNYSLKFTEMKFRPA